MNLSSSSVFCVCVGCEESVLIILVRLGMMSGITWERSSFLAPWLKYLMFNPASKNVLNLFSNFLATFFFFFFIRVPHSPKIIPQLGQIAVKSFLESIPVVFFPGGGVRFGAGRCKCSPCHTGVSCVCLGRSSL